MSKDAGYSKVVKFNAPNMANHDEAQRFVAHVGEQVRILRAEKGLTRKQLSLLSDVSERYLAQLETGSGNISISLLFRVSKALESSVARLFDSADAQSDLIQSYKKATRNVQAKVDELLNRGHAHVKKARRICLIGLRGAGKSTLGKHLSKDMNLPFVELNKEIEKDSGMAVNEVIALYGHEGYRRLERQALERIADANEAFVLAVGGGIVSDLDVYQFLLEHFHTVWLKASPEEHMDRVRKQGDERPMSGNPKAMEALKTILLERVELYSRADLMVDTSGKSVQESRAELASQMKGLDMQ